MRIPKIVTNYIVPIVLSGIIGCGGGGSKSSTSEPTVPDKPGSTYSLEIETPSPFKGYNIVTDDKIRIPFQNCYVTDDSTGEKTSRHDLAIIHIDNNQYFPQDLEGILTDLQISFSDPGELILKGECYEPNLDISIFGPEYKINVRERYVEPTPEPTEDEPPVQNLSPVILGVSTVTGDIGDIVNLGGSCNDPESGNLPLIPTTYTVVSLGNQTVTRSCTDGTNSVNSNQTVKGTQPPPGGPGPGP